MNFHSPFNKEFQNLYIQEFNKKYEKMKQRISLDLCNNKVALNIEIPDPTQIQIDSSFLFSKIKLKNMKFNQVYKQKKVIVELISPPVIDINIYALIQDENRDISLLSLPIDSTINFKENLDQAVKFYPKGRKVTILEPLLTRQRVSVIVVTDLTNLIIHKETQVPKYNLTIGIYQYCTKYPLVLDLSINLALSYCKLNQYQSSILFSLLAMFATNASQSKPFFTLSWSLYKLGFIEIATSCIETCIKLGGKLSAQSLKEKLPKTQEIKWYSKEAFKVYSRITEQIQIKRVFPKSLKTEQSQNKMKFYGNELYEAEKYKSAVRVYHMALSSHDELSRVLAGIANYYGEECPVDSILFANLSLGVFPTKEALYCRTQAQCKLNGTKKTFDSTQEGALLFPGCND
jgi:tetratricopeptide (TPR) repeat protein